MTSNHYFHKRVSVAHTDGTEFDPDEYFINYKSYAIYDESDPDFKVDPDVILYTINDTSKYTNVSYYVTKYNLSDDELEALEPYCQCSTCSRAWYNPWKYCNAYSGCVKYGNDGAYAIFMRKAIELQLEAKKLHDDNLF